MPPNAASDQGLHCLLTEISMENAVGMKYPQDGWMDDLRFYVLLTVFSHIRTMFR